MAKNDKIGCRVELFERGVRTVRKTAKSSVDKLKFCHELKNAGGGKRGKVTRWSANSRSRLREWLLTRTVPREPSGAVTLTVPGEVMPESEFRDFTSKFWREVQRAGIPCVWRIELQKRGCGHYHVVTWGRDAAFELSALWRAALGRLEVDFIMKDGKRYQGSRTGLPRAYEICAEISPEPPTGFDGWWRYLCDHASKKKRTQLGWQGRQWGVVNRKLFCDVKPEGIDMTEKQYKGFLRQLRRLTNSHKLRGLSGASVWFSSPVTVERIALWALDEYEVAPF